MNISLCLVLKILSDQNHYSGLAGFKFAVNKLKQVFPVETIFSREAIRKLFEHTEFHLMILKYVIFYK